MKFHYRDITIEVPDEIYYPREDTVLLADVLDDQDIVAKKVLEMGCGSGLLSIVAAKQGAFITAVDKDMEAIKITSKNARRNNSMMRIIHSDLFQNVTGSFDIIFFNPPYLPDEGDTHITYSGGPSGRDVVEKFINSVKPFLNSDGRILLLISTLTGEREVLDTFHKNGYATKILRRRKLPWEELIVIEAML